jgi:flavin reductase (DIM6/NTAB) family NADH-FMN oxidoreductase RutF
MFAGSGKEPKFLMTVHNYTDTCRLLKNGGEFVINLAAMDERERIERTMEHFADDVDELAASGFTAEPSSTVRPPRIREAYGHFECVVEWTRDVEEHEKRTTLIMGRIVAAAMASECMGDSARDAFARRKMPYHVAEFYDHGTRTVTADGWWTTLDLSPLPGAAPTKEPRK